MSYSKIKQNLLWIEARPVKALAAVVGQVSFELWIPSLVYILSRWFQSIWKISVETGNITNQTGAEGKHAYLKQTSVYSCIYT